MSKNLLSPSFLIEDIQGSRVISKRVLIRKKLISASNSLPEYSNHHLIKKRHAPKWIWHFFAGARYRRTMTRALPKIAKQIRFIALNWSFSASDKDLCFLSKYFNELPALKMLSLRSPQNDSPSVTNAGFNELSRGLKKFSSLESLELFFPYYDHFIDKRLKILSQGIRVNTSLKSLKLNFSGCSQITDLGICNLCKGLKNLGLLQNFSLDISRCRFATNKGFLEIKKLMKELRNLQQVRFDFSSWQGIDKNLIHSIVQDLDSLPLFRRITIRLWRNKKLIKTEKHPSLNFARRFLHLCCLKRKPL